MRKLPVLLAVVALAFRAAAADDELPRRLTLQQAREIALKQHPKISVASLIALAARQRTKEVQSAFLPTVMASATAVGTADPNNTRIAAGYMNNPLIYDREADGLTVSQLITDFGRTWELRKSAQSREQSERMNMEATRAQILLELDNAYFSTLQSQSVLEVARETVRERHFVLEQTQALATNQIRSQLDVSFASVDFDQANVLLAKASNDLNAAFAVLTTLLGESKPQSFQLAQEPMPAYTTNNASALIFEALKNRPDLVQLRYQRDAAKQFALAEGKLSYPTVNALGAAGVIPAGSSHLAEDYAAAGIDLNLPLYTGGLNAARRREAELEARAADEIVRDQEDTIVRDVQVTQLNLDYAHQRLALTEELLRNASDAMELAQARLNIGSGSIIEMSQAELNKTSAQIAEAGARYDYQIQQSALDFQLGRLR